MATTFLGHIGTVAGSIVKHVPTRGIAWAAGCFVLGWIWLALSFVVNVLLLGRGAELSVHLFPLVASLPVLGAGLFGVHGMQRGAARAALELQSKFGLVDYVVRRVVAALEPRVGNRLANIPLAQLEGFIKQSAEQYLGSDDMNEGRGLLGWVLRRAKRRIAESTETYLLSAYQAEQQADGSGGGISLERVGDRASRELSARLAALLMSPLNKQAVIFMVLYAAVGIFWLPLILVLLSFIPAPR